MKKMNERLILVTNDDGVGSRGMAAAIEVARTFGRTVVVAPETMQSGMSQAITMYSPLFLRHVREEEGLDIYAFSGTPVDCVKMAFDYLLRDEKIDLVISGINHGSNSAVNVLYSGTMGAAIEGSFYGCPSIGLSLDDHSAEADFEASVVWGKRIIGDVLARNERLPLCLNVNVPIGRPDEIRGMRLCRQNRGFWREEFFRHEDPRGSAGKTPESGAKSSSATKTPAAANTSGSRALSLTTNPKLKIPTNGPCRTAMSRSYRYRST